MSKRGQYIRKAEQIGDEVSLDDLATDELVALAVVLTPALRLRRDSSQQCSSRRPTRSRWPSWALQRRGADRARMMGFRAP